MRRKAAQVASESASAVVPASDTAVRSGLQRQKVKMSVQMAKRTTGFDLFKRSHKSSTVY